MSGYSVCLRSRLLEDLNQPCKCAHSLPAICDTPGKRLLKSRPVDICYLASLRRPPKLSLENKNDSIIAVVSTFWADPYWKELKLSNLTIFYEFLVDREDQCEGTVIKNDVEEKNYTCSRRISVDIYGDDSQNDDVDDDDVANDQKPEVTEGSFENSDASIEVEFERNIFAGAKYVKFWYEVDVKQVRQMNVHEAVIIPEVETVIESELEDFDTQPEIYGSGMVEEDEITKVEEEDKMDDDDDDNGADADDDKEDQEDAAAAKGQDQGAVMDKKTIEEISKQTDFFNDDDSNETQEEDGVSKVGKKKENKGVETTTVYTLKYEEGELDTDDKDKKKEQADDSDDDSEEDDDKMLPDTLRQYSSRFQPSNAGKKKEALKEKAEDDDDNDEDSKEDTTEAEPEAKDSSTSTPTTSATTTTTKKATRRQQTTTTTEDPITVNDTETTTNATLTFVASLMRRVNTTQLALATGALGIILIVSTLVLVSWCCCRKKETFSTYHASTRKDNRMNGNSTYKYTATIQTRPDTLPEKELLNQ